MTQREVYLKCLYFLAIVAELATIGGSFYLTIKGTIDGCYDLMKAGYKVNMDKMKELKASGKLDVKQSPLKKLLGWIIFLLPGINMLRIKMSMRKLSKLWLKNEDLKNTLEPMTEEEMKHMQSLSTKFERIEYVASLCEDKEKKEATPVEAVDANEGLVSLSTDPLEPIGYTLDDVKALNKATTYSYKVGVLRGKNTAIIGIPNPDKEIKNVRLNLESFVDKHEFTELSDEDFEGKTFEVVYPFSKYNLDDVKEVVAKIKKRQYKETAKSDLEEIERYRAEAQIEQQMIDANEGFARRMRKAGNRDNN